MSHAYAATAGTRPIQAREANAAATDEVLQRALEMLPADARETLELLVGESEATIATMLSTLPFGSRSALETAGLARPNTSDSKIWRLTATGHVAVRTLAPSEADEDDASEQELQAHLNAQRTALEEEFGQL
jgi:hypothetical protein